MLILFSNIVWNYKHILIGQMEADLFRIFQNKNVVFKMQYLYTRTLKHAKTNVLL